MWTYVHETRGPRAAAAPGSPPRPASDVPPYLTRGGAHRQLGGTSHTVHGNQCTGTSARSRSPGHPRTREGISLAKSVGVLICGPYERGEFVSQICWGSQMRPSDAPAHLRTPTLKSSDWGSFEGGKSFFSQFPRVPCSLSSVLTCPTSQNTDKSQKSKALMRNGNP